MGGRRRRAGRNMAPMDIRKCRRAFRVFGARLAGRTILWCFDMCAGKPLRIGGADHLPAAEALARFAMRCMDFFSVEDAAKKPAFFEMMPGFLGPENRASGARQTEIGGLFPEID